MFQLWRIHDSEDSKCFPVSSYGEANSWNQRGWGIFWTPNSFAGGRRLLENLTKINYWYCELDPDQKIQNHSVKCGAQNILNRAPLVPSMIIESKRGYHLYWRAKSGASLEKWDSIAVNRLVPFWNADKRARDAARLLRVPGFMHLKDPSDPFLIRRIWEADCAYSQDEMLWKFPDIQAAEDAKRSEEARKKLHSRPQGTSDDLWDRVWALDCELALTALSGCSYVSGEQFTFRDNRTGTKQICVNGKSTSCWIDSDGRIGSMDGGGPTVAHWLHWYGHPWSVVVRALKEIVL